MTTAATRPAPETVTTPPAAEPASAPRPYRLTIEKYVQMVEAGIFGPQDHLFLWEGQLVEAITKGDPHCFAMAVLNRFLARQVPDDWFIAPERPLALPDHSMPEPDFMVVRGAPRDYLHRPPHPGDAALVVEVSESSLAFDRGEKLRSYAAHAVPVYWIVNIPERRIEVYTEPTGPADPPRYGQVQLYYDTDEVPVVLDGREVGRLAAREVLP